MGVICWPTEKLGPKTAVSLYGGPFGSRMTWWQNVAFSTISLYRGSFDCPMTKWDQTVAISTISQYGGPSGGPCCKVGPKYGNFKNQNIWETIWWPNEKIGPKTALFTN